MGVRMSEAQLRTRQKRTETAKVGAITGQDEDTGIRDISTALNAISDSDAAMPEKPAARYMTSKPKRPQSYPEHAQQVAFVQWARMRRNQSQYPGLDLLHCSLNGQKMTKSQAGRARAAGMLAGIPDLFVPAPVGGYSGLFIEMKFGENTTSAAQDAVIAKLRARGYCVEVCWSAKEAIRAVEDDYMRGDDA